ncbi:TetR/AcrR family transcriptional regulator [Amycolatopsis sp. NPDC004368]
MIEPTAERVPRRRTETRRRLLDAALPVFAEEGFGRSTVEQVCERAGYTRGAFYSNFASLDELFLAMWERRSAAMTDAVRTAFDEVTATDLPDVRAIVKHVLPAIPVDDVWFRVSAEFTAHALRNPSLLRVMTSREDAIAGALMPLLVELLARVGRSIPDPVALGQALVALHDGTSAQCLIDPGNPLVRRRREDLFVQVITAYTKES